MRAEIRDWAGQSHVIDSQDPELVGRWFVEKALRLMAVNAAVGECRLRIWPSTREEQAAIGRHDSLLTGDGLRKLAESILSVSGRLDSGG
jgi:hypothetical protein